MNCVLKKVEAYFTEGWMIKLRNCNMVNQSWSSFINVKKKNETVGGKHISERVWIFHLY